MADGVQINIDGFDALKRALSAVPNQIRTKAVRSALIKAGNVIKNKARSNSPVLQTPTKRRVPGTIKKNIVVRPSKFARRDGNEGVFIGIRPIRGKARIAKLGKKGKDNPNDPYYWWWQEFGWIPRGPGNAIKGGKRAKEIFRAGHAHLKVPGKRFLSNAASLLGEANDVFMASVIPQIEKLNAKAGNVR